MMEIDDGADWESVSRGDHGKYYPPERGKYGIWGDPKAALFRLSYLVK